MFQIPTFFKSTQWLFIFTLFVIASCSKFATDTHWNMDLKAPLIYSRLDLKDIFGDTLAIYNPDQSVTLVLNQPITAIDNNSLIEVNDTLSNDIVSIPFSFWVMPNQKVINKSGVYHLELGDVELKSAKAKTAFLFFKVKNTIKQPLLVRYEVTSSEKDGITFFVFEDVPAADANGPSVTEKFIDLAGYTMDFTGANHNLSNMVLSNTTIWIHPDADSVYITPKDTISVLSIFDKLEIENVTGYFGQINETVKDSSSLNTFSVFKSGSFHLSNVKASLDITNGLGVDVQMRINEISSGNSKLSNSIPLQHDIIGKNLNLTRASLSGNSFFPVNESIYSYDLTGSNLLKIIENQPDRLGYNINYKINPLGNISGGNDFIYSNYSLKGNIHLEIPLKVRLDSLVIQQTTSINTVQIEEINSGRLVIITDNLFPFDVELQFYVLDSAKNIIDSLIGGNVISHRGVMDNQGFVLLPTTDQFVIPISSDKIQLLQTHKDILVSAKAQSQHIGNVQLFENYGIDIKVIMEANYEF